MNELTLGRFLDKVTIPANVLTGCWEWTGGKDRGGYDTLFVDEKTTKAHRLAFEHLKGPIPAGGHVLHTCDNPSCVNAEHLFTGTHDLNMKDKVSKGRQSRSPGEKHPQARLTEELVREIFNASGTQRAIAAQYGISQMHVWRIKNNESWKHLKENV